MTVYTVTQYRPAYFEGFENEVVEHVDEKDLMNPEVLPWLKNFQHEGFVEFYIDRVHPPEHIIVSARFADGSHWVAAIAKPESNQ